jgi:hypothetical protein
MKKIGIIALFAAVLSFTSCTVSNVTTTNNSAATSAGTSCGKVLSTLYTQYKSTGKVDMTNSNTLLNVVELATYYTTLKANRSNAAYTKAFAVGMVSGSNGLVTNLNSTSVINALLAITGLSGITTNTSGVSTAAISVANGLINLFKILKA